MGNVIDEQVVQMQFDNRDFEKNVSQSMSTLDKLKNALKFSDSSDGLDNLGSKLKSLPLNGLSSAVDTVGRRFSAMEVMGVTALANITNSVVNTGKQMLNRLTFKPITDGFAEYELKMGSVQTIQASTGESLGKINGYLDELNKYADRTIYSFSDMTANIGKFTNSGVKLKDAVAAIQGISNVAAVSGANTQEASRAMYNFSQALSSGSVLLRDWMSIENANMATVEFKNELIKTAVECKTLEKTGDGMYKSLTTNAKGATSEAFNASKGFRDNLSYQWMTTEVLTKTLAKYVDETTELGKKAFAAAQDVKTFTMMMDALEEAVGSGWAQTYEIIFGDFDEAKKLWTGMNDALSGFITAAANSRNEMLQSWKDLGGRKELIDGLVSAFNGLMNIIKPIRSAFRTIFPPKTGKDLKDLTRNFAELMKKFEEFTAKIDTKLYNGFRGIAEIIKVAKTAIGGFFKEFKAGLGEGPINLINSLVDGFSDFGKKITEIYKEGGFKDFTDIVSKLGYYLGTGLANAANIASGAFGILKKAISVLADVISTVVGKLKQFVDTIKLFDVVDAVIKHTTDDIKDVADAINGVKMPDTKPMSMLIKFFTTIASIGAKAGAAISTAFDKIIDFASKNITFDNISNVLHLINQVIAGGTLRTIGNFFSGKMFSGEAATTFKGFFVTVQDTLEDFGKSFEADILMKIAKAIGILAASIFVLSMIDPMALAVSTAAITKMFNELTATLAVFKDLTFDGLTGIAGPIAMLNGMATAIAILAGALFTLSQADPKNIAIATGVLLVLMQAMIKMMAAVKFDAFKEGTLKIGIVLLMLAESIKILAKSVIMLSSLNLKQLAIGLGGLAGAMLILAGALLALDKIGGKKLQERILPIAGALAILAVSMIAMATAIKIFTTMSWDDLGRGLSGFAASLILVSGALLAMSKIGGKKLRKNILPAAGAIAIVAASMLTLAASMKVFASISSDELITAMIGFGGALTIVGSALFVLSTMGGDKVLASAAAIGIVAASMMTLASVIAVIGALPLSVVIQGLVAIGVGLGVIVAVGYAAGGAAIGLLALSGAMIALSIAVMGIGAGVLLLSAGLTALSTMTMVAATNIVATLGIIVAGVIGFIPMLVTALVTGFVTLLQAFTKNAPIIIKEVLNFVKETLTALKDNLPEIIKLVADLLIDVMDTLNEKIPELVESAVKLVISVIDGTATAIEEHKEEIIDAIEHIITAVFELLGGLGERLYEKVNEATDGGLDAIMESVADFIVAGEDIVKGIIQGIKDKIDAAKEAIGKVASSIKNTFKELLGIHSPSKVMMSYAGFMIDGLVIGLKKGTPAAVNQSTDTVGKMLDSMTKTVKKKMKFSRNAFQEYVNILKPSIKSTKDATNAIKAAASSLEAFILKQYQHSDAYKQDRENIKNAKKDIKSLTKELNKAKKSRAKDRAKEVKDIKAKLKDARKALKDAKKESENNIKQISKNIHSGLADSIKSFLDPLSLTLNESSPYDEILAPSYDDIKKVGELTEQYNNLNEQYKALDDTQKNTRAAYNLLDQMDEISRQLDTLHEKIGDNLSPEQLLKNMENQANADEIFQENLKRAAEKGLSPEIVANLKKKGKEANSTLVAFLEMNDEQIERSNKAFSKKAASDATAFLNAYLDQTSAAKKWANDMATLAKKGINQDLLVALGDAGPESQATVDKLLSMTANEFKKFSDKYGNNLKLDDKLADKVIASYALAGVNSAKGFANGLASSEGLKALDKASEKLAKKVVKQVKKYLGIHSPSTVFRELGLYSDEGLAEGFEDGSDSLTARVLKMLSKLENDVADKLETLSEDESTEFSITPVIEGDSQVQEWVSNFKSKMQEYGIEASKWRSSALAGNISSSFTYKAGDDFATMASELKRLQGVLISALNEDRINQTNEFHIESNDPQGVADEVNRILQTQLERRNAVWA